MEDLKVTKDKLKKVANAWAEIESLQDTTIFDVTDSKVNWNKKVELSGNEELIDKKLGVLDAKPLKKSLIKPFPAEHKSIVFVLVLAIIFGTISLALSAGFFIANVFEWLSGSFLIAFVPLFIIVAITLFLMAKQKIKVGEQKSAIFIVELIINIFCSVCCLVCLIIFILPYTGNLSRALPLAILMIITYAITYTAIYFVCKNYYENKMSIKNFNRQNEEYQQNLIYNEQIYPQKLNEYEEKIKQLDKLRKSYLQKVNQTNLQIGKLYNQIEEIDIISVSQAKYAGQLLDYIYKGAESIKEAFEMLEADKEKQEKVMELSISKNQITVNADTSNRKQSKWKKLSKLAKAAILVPIIYFIPALVIIILASVIKTPSMIAILVTLQLITFCFAGGVFIFEAIAIGILLYRKHKDDLGNIIDKNSRKSWPQISGLLLSIYTVYLTF